MRVHCKAHSLNLAVINACKEPLVRNTMDTVQAIAFAFDYSAKRLTFFKENLEEDNIAKEAMQHRTKLQTLCETRWYSRPDALHTFKACLTTVCHALDTLEQDGDAKARSYGLSVRSFDLIVTLVTTEHILQSTVQLSLLLQSKSLDLLEAVRETQAVIQVLQEERNDDAVWDALYEEALELAARVDVEPKKPRQAGRQQHRVNVPADSISAYWRRAMYYPFMDHLIEELKDRLIQPQERFVAQVLIPSRLQQTTPDDIAKVYQAYSADMPGTLDQLHNEFLRWKARWNLEPKKPDTLAETVSSINQLLYPNIYIALLILITMPVSSSTAERAFSVMKRVKSYLRANMTTFRMSSLAVLHAHKDTDINLDDIVDVFASRKQRRLAFLIN